jgi:small subunit ribosomal protein S9
MTDKVETKTEKKKPAKKPSRKKEKVFIARGKRKTSVARATITPGKGNVRVNNQLVDSFNNKYVRDIMKEPLDYVGPEANSVDISVDVYGGGMMGQAQAVRTAIARALMGYFSNMKLKDKFVAVDRSLIVEDPRRVESKKYKGPKARARYQKSYR